MTQNLYVCTICFRTEVVYDVVSGRNVKTIESYPVINFEVASSIVSEIFKTNHFVTSAAADIDDSIKPNRFRVSSEKQ